MFTLQQLKAAHAKVKSGADFPRYIQEIKSYGLLSYTFNVTDGSIVYQGENGHQVIAPAIYPLKAIAAEASPEALRYSISIHQQGQTDFVTFCDQVAAAGVLQWVIDTQQMRCIYEDEQGKEMVTELIPQIG